MGRVFLEPRALGDAVIAAAVARAADFPVTVACNPRWHPLLEAGFGPEDGHVSLDAVTATYGRRSPGKDEAATAPSRFDVDTVYSARGDPRDFLLARRQFPEAEIRFGGWSQFFARHSAVLDALFTAAGARVRNRYEMWASLAGLEFGRVAARYPRWTPLRAGARVALHVGAAWRSRQYPAAGALAEALRGRGIAVKLCAAPGDPLPAGVREDEIVRVAGAEAVALFHGADAVVANDSGPMHLAAFLGRPTFFVELVSNPLEWCPPGAAWIAGEGCPTSFRSLPSYCTDEVLDAWPDVPRVLERLMEAA